MATDTIERIEKRIAVLEARRDRHKARQRERDRKRDTRRKILLGAALLARARSGDAPAVTLVSKLLDGLSARERAVFDGWTL